MGETQEPSQSQRPEKPAVSRTLVVVMRVVLLLLAGSAVAAAIVIATRERTDQASTRYACPMHPEVRSARPGPCPICGMALEPSNREDASSKQLSSMVDLQAVENVRKHKVLDFVRMRSLPSELRELRAAAWVENDRSITASFYRDQADAIALDEAGTFSPSRAPQAVLAVRRIGGIEAAGDRSLARVRFRLDEAPKPALAVRLEPGEVGWIELRRRLRNVLTVPAAAIVQAPEGPYVLKVVRGLEFEKRPIEIGETFLRQGFAVVLSGLNAQDRVVGKATFFLDAERKLGGRAGDAAENAP